MRPEDHPEEVETTEITETTETVGRVPDANLPFASPIPQSDLC
jgi:hypothetical protein